MPNRLAKETSPYLLQHAENPVDWYPWGEEALQLAKREDKPILVSIGYSACHWCHVMEHESFEDEATARLMNALFVCIKVDREERPDLDNIYMSAVQTMTGQGGWPLNVFLTPDKKPFTGGTYFPPKNSHGRPSWKEVLRKVSEIFKKDRSQVEEQSDKLTEHVGSLSDHFRNLETDGDFAAETHLIYDTAARNFDNQEGGFGAAPKFPSSMPLQFLLRYARLTKQSGVNLEKGKNALEHVALSIRKMTRGGIYDQLGGGFSRYTVDHAWQVPHFEKMLYDNALLIKLMAEYHKVSPNIEFENAVYQTIDFLKREMLHPDGGFYAALDADSEGVEGKFYVWSESDIDAALGQNAAAFKTFMNVVPEGNWEGVNILNRTLSAEEYSKNNGMDSSKWAIRLEQQIATLLELREKRIRPGLDDKILLGWNCLMSSALFSAWAAWGEKSWCDLALDNLRFIAKSMSGADGMMHSWKEGKVSIPAFLDDYAAYIRALLDQYEAIFDEEVLEDAQRWTEFVLARFSDEEQLFFYFTARNQSDVVIRTMELTDNAVPSGNAMMASNLIRLGSMIENEPFVSRGEKMLRTILPSAVKYATSFGEWSSAIAETAIGRKEIVVVGEQWQHFGDVIRREFRPEAVLLATESSGNSENPLFAWRGQPGKTLVYLCVNQQCDAPVDKPDDLGYS